MFRLYKYTNIGSPFNLRHIYEGWWESVTWLMSLQMHRSHEVPSIYKCQMSLKYINPRKA